MTEDRMSATLLMRSLCASVDGGVSLALRNGSSAGIGMMELMELLRAFEKQNTCMITLTGRSVERVGKLDWQWEAKAWATEHTLSGRQLLACANVRCGEKRLLSMEAVVLQLLYALDFMLGQHEWESVEPKS
jgi:hypothetical protein